MVSLLGLSKPFIRHSHIFFFLHTQCFERSTAVILLSAVCLDLVQRPSLQGLSTIWCGRLPLAGLLFRGFPGVPLSPFSSFRSPSNGGLAEVSRDTDAGWRFGKRCELQGGGGAEARGWAVGVWLGESAWMRPGNREIGGAKAGGLCEEGRSPWPGSSTTPTFSSPTPSGTELVRGACRGRVGAGSAPAIPAALGTSLLFFKQQLS